MSTTTGNLLLQTFATGQNNWGGSMDTNLQVIDIAVSGAQANIVTLQTAPPSNPYANSNVAAYLPINSTIIGLDNSLAGANTAIQNISDYAVNVEASVINLTNEMTHSNASIAGANASILDR